MTLDPHRFPRISFGIIVLNGHPFTRYCLRQLYPHAHEIIVVEGASDKAAAFCPDGHSTDGTLATLEQFKLHEDPEGKLQLVTKTGFWEEKDAQSQAYATRANGDYLWQVDIDEFYRHDDIEQVRRMLANDSTIDTMSFRQRAFWGHPGIMANSFALVSDQWDEFHRLFRWKKGHAYRTHRPPTVTDQKGVDLREKHWIRASESEKAGIVLFHYSLLFPVQVSAKCRYYAAPSSFTGRAYAPNILRWADNCYFTLGHPFRVHNFYKSISWLERYEGTHPEEAAAMWEHASAGQLGVDIRDNADAERLLAKRTYWSATKLLSALACVCCVPPANWGRRLLLRLKTPRKRPIPVASESVIHEPVHNVAKPWLAPHEFPRITFGVIVLNGEPFTRHCLRQLYPHASDIIVVEGGSEKARGTAPDGHSTDGTLEALRRFKEEEDPDNKLTIISKNGFWSEKDEQSQAYAAHVTGDYLWQVDIDEFYRHYDIERIRRILIADPTVDTISFKQRTFWGSLNVAVDSFALIADGWDQVHRIFRWKEGYAYKMHRPPTVVDECGLDLRQRHWIGAAQTEKLGITMFHYSLLFPKQVRSKSQYYGTSSLWTERAYAPEMVRWADDCYFSLKRPFRVHNVYKSISWLDRYRGDHPEEVLAMWAEVSAGGSGIELRNNTDAERLLSSRSYWVRSKILKRLALLCLFPPANWLRFGLARLGSFKHAIKAARSTV